MGVIIDMHMPKDCGKCPCCIFTSEEKDVVGYCNTSDEDYYCKVLDRFMAYEKIDDSFYIKGKPTDCPLKSVDEMTAEIKRAIQNGVIKIEIGNEYLFSIIHKYCDKENKDGKV